MLPRSIDDELEVDEERELDEDEPDELELDIPLSFQVNGRGRDAFRPGPNHGYKSSLTTTRPGR